MARNDVYIYTNAASPAAAIVASKTSTTAADFPELVLGDSPLFNLYFTDGTNFETWAGNVNCSVTWAISESVAEDVVPLAIQNVSTPISGGWSVRLPLQTRRLVEGVSGRSVSQENPVVRLWQHIRVTDANGYNTTYAKIRTVLRLREIPDSSTLPDDPYDASQSSLNAAAAAASASAASNSAGAANSYALSALSSSNSATNSAQTASNAAIAAAADALAADASADLAAASQAAAVASASDAHDDAASAHASALSAGSDATSANGSAVSAYDNAQLAAGHANDASVSASQASSLAGNASSSANAAQQSALSASASAVSASVSASSAIASANSAAASAAVVVGSINNTYKGGLAGASVPATSTLQGDYYRITSAGSSQGKTWATGDIAIYEGTSGHWTQVPAGVVDATELANKVNPRAPRQGLVLNGTAGASLTLGSAIGTSSATFDVPITVPSSVPASANGIFAVGAFGTGNSLSAYVDSDAGGTLTVILTDTTPSNYVSLRLANFVTNYAGKRVNLSIVRDSVTPSCTVYVNGVAQTMTSSPGGTPPTWAATISSTSVLVGKMGASSFYFTGYVGALTVENRALSASEILALYETSTIPASDIVASSQIIGTSLVPANFASGWSTDGGFTPGTSGAFTASGNAYKLNTLVVGKRYRFTVTVASYSGTTGAQYYNGASYTSFATGNGTYSVEFVAAGTTFIFNAGIDAAFSLSSPTLVPLGALLAPDQSQPGAGTMWRDVSGNNATITWSSGISWAVPSGVGDYFESTVLGASAVSLSTGTAKTVTFVTLTPGDWDVSAVGKFTGGAITGTNSIVSVSLVDNTLGIEERLVDTPLVPTSASDVGLSVPSVRMLVTTTTPVYLVVRETFTVGSAKAYGTIRARRVR